VRNIGNTCYLAAALNALAAVPELFAFFAPTGAWRRALAAGGGAGAGATGGDLAAALSALLREATAGAGAAARAGAGAELRRLAAAAARAPDGAPPRIALPQRLSAAAPAAALSPAALKAVCARANAFVFGNKNQQDAQEALSFLLDALTEDTNGAPPRGGGAHEPDPDDAAVSARACGAASLTGAARASMRILSPAIPTHPPPAQVARLRAAAAAAAAAAPALLPLLAGLDADAIGDAALAADAWARHARRVASPLAPLLHGQFANRVACRECGASSLRFEAFTLLSLPVEPEGAVVAVVRKGRARNDASVWWGERSEPPKRAQRAYRRWRRKINGRWEMNGHPLGSARVSEVARGTLYLPLGPARVLEVVRGN
jgi:hypothetical protein